MNCPKCNSKSSVYDSRTTATHTRRRRVCPKCAHRFTTVEIETDARDKSIERVLVRLSKNLEAERGKTLHRLQHVEGEVGNMADEQHKTLNRLKHLESEITELVDVLRAAIPHLADPSEDDTEPVGARQ